MQRLLFRREQLRDQRVLRQERRSKLLHQQSRLSREGHGGAALHSHPPPPNGSLLVQQYCTSAVTLPESWCRAQTSTPRRRRGLHL